MPESAKRQATRLADWVLGCNPTDFCMFEGVRGRVPCIKQGATTPRLAPPFREPPQAARPSYGG